MREIKHSHTYIVLKLFVEIDRKLYFMYLKTKLKTKVNVLLESLKV